MLVDSGATQHCLEDGPIPGLKYQKKDHALMYSPKATMTTGKRELLGTATGIHYVTIVDQIVKKHRVWSPAWYFQA